MIDETQALLTIQRRVRHRPTLRAVGLLSAAGEHGGLWLGASAVLAAAGPATRRAWTRVFAATFIAHAVAVVLKRIVRRQRPRHPQLEVLVAVPSTLSFPSAHAASTTAFVTAAVMGVPGGRHPGWRAAGLALALSMAMARLLLGVHYPSDVLGGAVMGAGVGAVVHARPVNPA